MSLVDQVEAEVWRELGRRRWFGKHVEQEGMEELEGDLRSAIEEAIQAARATLGSL